MPSRITVGLTRKLGLPRFSSVGASCEVTLEAPDPAADPRGFAARAGHAFAACDRAVLAELARATAGPDSEPEEQCDDVPCGAAQSRALAALCRRRDVDPDALLIAELRAPAAIAR